MKDALVRTCTSLAAGLLGFVITSFVTTGMETKLVVAIVVAVCSFAIAAWVAPNQRDDPKGKVTVASELKGGSVNIEDVKAKVTPGQDVKLASGIEATGHIEIKRTGVETPGDEE